MLGEAIAACRCPPRVWLNSSTATIYRHSFDRPMDEATGEIGATPEAKDAFSVEVARAWEKALDDAYGVRTARASSEWTTLDPTTLNYPRNRLMGVFQ